MALHGDLMVNYNKIGRWEAVRKGSTGVNGEFIYRCLVNFTDMKGYENSRRFYVRHMFADGALVLAGKVMLESAVQMRLPEVSDSTAWINFSEAHNINHYALLD